MMKTPYDQFNRSLRPKVAIEVDIPVRSGVPSNYYLEPETTKSLLVVSTG